MDLLSLACPACGLRYEGRFRLPRLARLNAEQQQLAERLLLATGNLKAVAEHLGISYPTLRKRLDELQGALEELCEADQQATDRILQDVEAGRLGAEEAARLIREQSGGA